MKKWRVLLTMVIIFLVIALLVIGSVFIYQVAKESITVFDLANFVTTIVFSLTGLVISLIEFRNNSKAEKAAAAKQARVEELKDEACALIDGMVADIEKLKPLLEKESGQDYPTYSNVPLEEMCELYKSIHLGSVEKKKEEDNSSKEKTDDETICYKEAGEIIEKYIASVTGVLALIVKYGESLPPATVQFATMIGEHINGISEDYAHFNQLSGINLWTIGAIQKNTNDIYGMDESQKYKYLYHESCAVCMAFEELMKKVQTNFNWIGILNDSLSEIEIA